MGPARPAAMACPDVPDDSGGNGSLPAGADPDRGRIPGSGRTDLTPAGLDGGRDMGDPAQMGEITGHEVVHGPSMPPPMGHASQAVQAGNLPSIAGQPGIDLGGSVDPDTVRAVPGGSEAEWRHGFRNLQAISDDAGCGLEHVVTTTTFRTDLADGEAANRLATGCLPTNPPARSSPVVVLPRGRLRSGEAVAVVPGASGAGPPGAGPRRAGPEIDPARRVGREE